MSSWIYLGLACVFEIIFAVSMKSSAGFTKLWPSAITIAASVGGIVFLTMALKSLPVSIAYPIWTAIGTLGTLVLGFIIFSEDLNMLKILSAALIIAGVAGLKIASA